MLLRFSFALVLLTIVLTPGVLPAQEPTPAAQQPEAAETIPRWPSTDPSAHHGYLMHDGAYQLATDGPIQWPKVLHAVDPKYPRHDKISGVCVLSLIVDTKGRPDKIAVVRSLRSDFDKNALHAVQQYKFAPATLDGKPVPVEIKIEVKFQIFP